MNGKTAAIWGALVAVGTLIGWTLSIGVRLGSLASVDRVDAVASAQLAVDRQVLAQFTAVDVAIARLQTGAEKLEKSNDQEHAELKHRIEKVAETAPRIVAGK
jgi:hypothetical protein